jgi:hypothetical protein
LYPGPGLLGLGTLSTFNRFRFLPRKPGELRSLAPIRIAAKIGVILDPNTRTVHASHELQTIAVIAPAKRHSKNFKRHMNLFSAVEEVEQSIAHMPGQLAIFAEVINVNAALIHGAAHGSVASR